MYEETLIAFDFTEKERSKLMALFSKTSNDDLRLSVGLRYFINKAETLPDLVLSLEAISYGLSLGGNTQDQLKNCFREYLSTEEKISLLKKWAFSRKYKLGERIGDYEHLMKGEQLKDSEWHKENDDPYFHYDKECYTGENWFCQCEDWLRDNENKIDNYIDQLVEKFYAMRCAMYHNAFPIFIADRFEDYEEVTSYEVYMHGSNKLESFMTDKTFEDMKILFQGIIKKMIKENKNI
jgi:hypothetical protein